MAIHARTTTENICQGYESSTFTTSSLVTGQNLLQRKSLHSRRFGRLVLPKFLNLAMKSVNVPF